MNGANSTGQAVTFGEPARAAARRPLRVVETSALFAGVLFSGVFAGFLIGVLILELSLRSFDASVYTQARLAELAHLDDLASVLLPAAIITTAIVLVVTIMRREPTRWLVLTALIVLAAVFAISLAVNVPINTQQHGWSVLAPPSDWASVRDRWQIAHLARSTLALISFAILIATALARRAPERPRTSINSPASG